MEGATGVGRLLAQQLVAAGEPVLDVPAALATRVRVLSGQSGRKTDAHDAVAVATAAIHHPRLRAVQAEDHNAVLRLKPFITHCFYKRKHGAQIFCGRSGVALMQSAKCGSFQS